MTKEELLRPRYKVIADYPNCPFSIGTILEQDLRTIGEIFTDEPMFDLDDVGRNDRNWVSKESIDKYPHLFKKLHWTDNRTLDELPEYIIIVEPNSLWEVDKDCVRHTQWLFNEFNQLVCDSFPLLINHIQLKRLMPATHQEYLDYITEKKDI